MSNEPSLAHELDQLAGMEEFNLKWQDIDKTRLVSTSALMALPEELLYYPLETLKVRQQANTAKNVSQGRDLLNTVRKIFYKERGVLSLYRGFGPCAVAAMPTQASFVCTYAFMRDKLTHANNKWSPDPTLSLPLVFMASGACGEMVAQSVFLPVDMVTARMQMGPDGKFGNIGGIPALAKVYHEEGGLRGLYRGYGVTVMHLMPASAIWFLSQETFKRVIHKSTNLGAEDDLLPMWSVHMCAGSLAGITTTLVTNPLDVIRTRILVTQESGQAVHDRWEGKLGERFRVVQHFKSILRKEGIRGFWKGVVPRLFMSTVVSAWSSVLLETVMEISKGGQTDDD